MEDDEWRMMNGEMRNGEGREKKEGGRIKEGRPKRQEGENGLVLGAQWTKEARGGWRLATTHQMTNNE